MIDLPGDWDEFSPDEIEVITQFATVVPLAVVTPSVYEGMSEYELRCKYASCWVSAGFRDASRVGAWISAGVESARRAGIAELTGYEPGDPWVEPCPPEFVLPGGIMVQGVGYVRFSRPSRLRAAHNRWRAWRVYAAEPEPMQPPTRREFGKISRVVAENFVPGTGNGIEMLRSVLDRGWEPEPHQVMAGFNDVSGWCTRLRQTVAEVDHFDPSHLMAIRDDFKYVLLGNGMVLDHLHVLTGLAVSHVAEQTKSDGTWLQEIYLQLLDLH